MATYDLPATIGVSSMEWGVRKSGVQFISPYSGTRQSLNFLGDRMLMSLTLVPVPFHLSGTAEAFFEMLAGGENRLRMWHRVRPVPRGTMRGTPTIASNVARGASTIPLQAQPGETLEAGDLFKAGNQVFKALFPAVANGSGLLTVSVVLRARFALPAGTVVTWNKPTADWILPANETRMPYVSMVQQGVPLDFEETWNG